MQTKEVSPLTNGAAQDLLLLKEKSMEVCDKEDSHVVTLSNAMETSLELPDNDEVNSMSNNKPAAVEIELSERQFTVNDNSTINNDSSTVDSRNNGSNSHHNRNRNNGSYSNHHRKTEIKCNKIKSCW